MQIGADCRTIAEEKERRKERKKEEEEKRKKKRKAHVLRMISIC